MLCQPPDCMEDRPSLLTTITIKDVLASCDLIPVHPLRDGIHLQPEFPQCFICMSMISKQDIEISLRSRVEIVFALFGVGLCFGVLARIAWQSGARRGGDVVKSV